MHEFPRFYGNDALAPTVVPTGLPSRAVHIMPFIWPGNSYLHFAHYALLYASMFVIILPSARMRSEGTVVGSVCLCVCVSVLTSHFSNVRLSHKRYDLPNGQ